MRAVSELVNDFFHVFFSHLFTFITFSFFLLFLILQPTCLLSKPASFCFFPSLSCLFICLLVCINSTFIFRCYCGLLVHTIKIHTAVAERENLHFILNHKPQRVCMTLISRTAEMPPLNASPHSKRLTCFRLETRRSKG